MLNFRIWKTHARIQGHFNVADPKQDEGFKVVDRRLFTEQGDLRQEVVEQERREEEASAKKAASAPAPSAVAPGQAAPGAAGLAGEAAPTESPEEKIPPSRNFQMLVDFLTRNAAAMLGGMADPRTGQAFLDLEGAREMIDMLDVLREKTKGNLAKADEDLLIEVAGSLKLTFVEISKAAADQMKKQTGVKK
ncbi:MAG: DUF1844 domain-containing protein [Candidatus Acidiferrales bacterium]